MPADQPHDEKATDDQQIGKTGKSGGLPPELLRFAAMGLEFIGAIAGGLFLGWLIDRWTGAYPLWTIAGVVVGLAAGAYTFFREAVRAGKLAKRDYEARHPPRDASGR